MITACLDLLRTGNGGQHGHYWTNDSWDSWDWAPASWNSGWSSHNWGGNHSWSRSDNSWPHGTHHEALEDTTMEDEYADEVTKVGEQKDLFWNSEEGTRVRTDQLSGYEKHQLTHHAWADSNKEHVTRVVQMFGCAKGATRNGKHLLKVLSEEAGLSRGQTVDLRGPGFSLCKHLHLASIKSLGDLPEDLEECHCLPKTALMVEGCAHKGPPLYKVDHFWKTLCPTCSTCIRCGG